MRVTRYNDVIYLGDSGRRIRREVMYVALTATECGNGKTAAAAKLQARRRPKRKRYRR